MKKKMPIPLSTLCQIDVGGLPIKGCAGQKYLQPARPLNLAPAAVAGC